MKLLELSSYRNKRKGFSVFFWGFCGFGPDKMFLFVLFDDISKLILILLAELGMNDSALDYKEK